MEATAGVAAASRGGSLSRKEWRAVTEQQHRNGGGGDENLEQSKLGQSDERTIYEVQHGRGLDVDFCSITVDEGLDDDILQQRIHSIARQREELQQLGLSSELKRERDHSEAERAQHIQQLRDLQEHIQDKERQISGVAGTADQETIYLKDEQLKVWIARVQEMDALQSNAKPFLTS
ncbi:hypothetical protein D5086_027750 [Populus alba]|uniref:Uncharacterized protein n=1 Tax=Populus alba TaxID=43335 RepID=A0ACC4AX26_POPAL|nr:uncharacterized protein LOC118057153 [Populus alba]